MEAKYAAVNLELVDCDVCGGRGEYYGYDVEGDTAYTEECLKCGGFGRVFKCPFCDSGWYYERDLRGFHYPVHCTCCNGNGYLTRYDTIE